MSIGKVLVSATGAVLLIVCIQVIPCFGGEEGDVNDPREYYLEFVSALSISYVPEMHPYDLVYRDLNSNLGTTIEIPGSRFVLAPGFKVKFIPKNSKISNGNFYFEVPISAFSSRFSKNRGDGSTSIEGGTSEISYGFRCGFSFLVIKGIFVSLGASLEKLQVSYRVEEAIYEGGGFLGYNSGEMSTSGDRFGIMPGVVFEPSKNILLTIFVNLASNSIDYSNLYLRLPGDNEVFESTTKLESLDDPHLEIGVTFVW